MTHLRVVLVAVFVALTASILAEDVASSQSEEDSVLDDVTPEAGVLPEGGSDITPMRFIGCDGVAWSCENCNTKRSCVEFFWTTWVTYFQCPQWTPYCNSTATTAWCTNTPPTGCGPTNSTG